MSMYHDEFARLIAGKDDFGLLAFLLNNVIEPILQRNKYYHRCNQSSKPNAGICLVLNEFRAYIRNGKRPPDERLRLFGELAYTFWLLGDKLQQSYESIVQKRVAEFFKGGAYYDEGEAGFRQFEYELQAICRLVEENVPFNDSAGDGEPDLTIQPSAAAFRVEIKLPLSNPISALRKALKQIGSHAGVVLICLDSFLASEPAETQEGEVRTLAGQILRELDADRNIAVVIEYYINDASETKVGWIGKQPTLAVATIMSALSVSAYDVASLPPPIVNDNDSIIEKND